MPKYALTALAALILSVSAAAPSFAQVLTETPAEAQAESTAGNGETVRDLARGLTILKILGEECAFTNAELATFERFSVVAHAGITQTGPIDQADIDAGSRQGEKIANSMLRVSEEKACEFARARLAKISEVADAATGKSAR